MIYRESRRQKSGLGQTFPNGCGARGHRHWRRIRSNDFPLAATLRSVALSQERSSQTVGGETFQLAGDGKGVSTPPGCRSASGSTEHERATQEACSRRMKGTSGEWRGQKGPEHAAVTLLLTLATDIHASACTRGLPSPLLCCARSCKPLVYYLHKTSTTLI